LTVAATVWLTSAMGLLERLLGRRRRPDDGGASVRDAVENYLDPLDPAKGTYGDMPEGVPGKPPGEGGAAPPPSGSDE
jgi:hypothetical protein